jgi:hypothetical protein
MLPKVLMVVTGKGPLKERYMREVERLQSGDGENGDSWEWVRCISHWLEAEDYPVLLGLYPFLFLLSFFHLWFGFCRWSLAVDLEFVTGE